MQFISLGNQTFNLEAVKVKINKRMSIVILSILLVVLLAGCGDAASGVNSADATNIEQPIQENGSGPAAEDEEPAEMAPSDPEATEGQKAEYLKKLNGMEESDRNSDAGTTMVEMQEQEEARYKKWDAELNTIYGILEEQLDPDEMEQLRTEQREWITHRDKSAEEASQKYEGGTMAPLEYVATQAELTKERCYELVAEYME